MHDAMCIVVKLSLQLGRSKRVKQNLFESNRKIKSYCLFEIYSKTLSTKDVFFSGETRKQISMFRHFDQHQIQPPNRSKNLAR